MYAAHSSWLFAALFWAVVAPLKLIDLDLAWGVVALLTRSLMMSTAVLCDQHLPEDDYRSVSQRKH